jgi:hypothetical protein
MSNFAILDDENIVENIVTADDFAVLAAFFPEKTIIEETEETKIPFIGTAYDENTGKFIPLKPFSSWIFDEEKWAWEAPSTYPDNGNYTWDEESTSWVKVAFEEPSV